jgi:hypothetical protein
MKLGHTAIMALGFLALTMAAGDVALAQPHPLRAVVTATPATWFDADYNTSQLHARYSGGDLQLAGTVTQFRSDGTTPAPNTLFKVDIPNPGGDVLAACFTAANQARLAGGSHTLRVSVSMVSSLNIAAGEANPPRGGVRLVICELDP